MATTSIWSVKSNLGKTLDYIINPEKTTREDSTLIQVLEYTTRSEKIINDTNIYATGINCNLKSAITEMNDTKNMFGKTGGVLAYHAYQSFAEGEVTADECHAIGVELAEKMWGDRFQVVVTTHLDKEHHLHNHFVINSVSFKDGKKMAGSEMNQKRISFISDKLCRENGKSVIERTAVKGKNYNWRNLVKQDVDEAIQRSATFPDFLNYLENLGYDVKDNNKYISIRPKGKERYVRLRSLGVNYDEEKIIARLNKPYMIIPPKRIYRSFSPTWKKRNKVKGFRGLVLKYMYLLGFNDYTRYSTKNMDYKFRKAEEVKFKKFAERATYICSNKINNTADLKIIVTNLNSRKYQIEKLRTEKRKLLRRERNPDIAEVIANDIAVLNDSLKKIRKELKICEDIESETPKIKNKIEEIERTKNYGRNRPNDKTVNRRNSASFER